jgi:hypothetical protein
MAALETVAANHGIIPNTIAVARIPSWREAAPPAWDCGIWPTSIFASGPDPKDIPDLPRYQTIWKSEDYKNLRKSKQANEMARLDSLLTVSAQNRFLVRSRDSLFLPFEPSKV